MLTVEKVESKTELFHKFPRQSDPQPCFVELDCREKFLCSRHNPEIGNARPFDVAHARVIRWDIPILKADDANDLIEEIIPLAKRILAGYGERWDGDNHIGTYTDDALCAIDEIDAACQALFDDDNAQVQWADAGDWLSGANSPLQWAAELGITPDTTDDELDAIGEAVVETCCNDIDVLTDLDTYLAECRTAAIDAAEVL